jgi:glycosyltransferase involved in cell wall biosynthesis
VTRVLIAGPLPPPHGGVTTSISELVRVADKADIVIFDTSTHGSVNRAGIWSPRNAAAAVSHAIRLRRAVHQARPDIVQVEAGGYLGLLKGAALLFAIPGVPTILSVHSPHVGEDARAATPLGALLIRRALRRADAIRVVHTGQRFDLVKLEPRLGDADIYVIPNSIAAPATDPSEVLPARAEDTLRIISVGAIGRRKGTHDLLKALVRVRDQGIRFACDVVGPEERRGDREALTLMRDRAGLTGHVTFRGERDNSEVRDLLGKADVFVLPAYAEGLPLAILEAMAAGLPVVATNVGGIKDALGQSDIPILEPGDVDAIADVLSDLAREPALRRRSGLQNLERVRTTFRPEAIGERFHRLWMDVGAQRTTCSRR